MTENFMVGSAECRQPENFMVGDAECRQPTAQKNVTGDRLNKK
jgi:hypothetical protein